MTNAQLVRLNASFGSIPNFGNLPSGVSYYAVLPFGGAYILNGSTYVKVANSNTIYDIADLRAHLFETNKHS